MLDGWTIAGSQGSRTTRRLSISALMSRSLSSTMRGYRGPMSEETLNFLRRFRDLIDLLHQDLPSDEGSGETLVDVLQAHLGTDPRQLAIVTEQVVAHRLVDADLAMESIATADPDARLVGIGGGNERHHMQFGDILQHARRLPVGQVDYTQMDTGPQTEDVRQVVTSGVWLFRREGVPVAVRVTGRAPQYGRQDGAFEVMAAERPTSDAVVTALRTHLDTHSVVRGQIVTFSNDPFGHGFAGLTFVKRPTLQREDVVLPEGVLDRVAGHVVGIGERREQLRRHRQHLKRGVLLYGPPGTGKTHTVRYLLSATPGTTAVLLAGMSLSAIGVATRLARANQPAIVVLEDVDLVAEDRSFSNGPQPLLFEVLDALDGLDADADVAFLLTTNRVDDLERALAQRPGRVDLAAEVPLPDAAARRALMRLYGGAMFSDEALDAAADRSAGTTASFAKELVRRAVLGAAEAEAEPADEHLDAALSALLGDSESLTRSLLGVARSQEGPGGPEATTR